MQIVDTNVIIRYLVADVKELYLEAEKIFTEALTGKRKLFITQSVIAEVIFVLSKLYKIPRKDIAEAINFFLNVKSCKVQNEAAVRLALDIYQKSNLSFIDCLICAFSKTENLELITFDKLLRNKCRKLPCQMED